jgi:DNA-binding CsgD family transcriptional regulator
VHLIDEQTALNAVRTRTLQQFVESLESSSEDVLIGKFVDFASTYRLTSVASVALKGNRVVTPDCVLVNTRPSTWTREYLDNGFIQWDPILEYASSARTPFSWDAALANQELTRTNVRVMNHSADHGISDGFVVPIFETSGWAGLVSMAGRALAIDAVGRSRLTLAAVYLHNRLAAVNVKEPRQPVPLTGREREILQWIAAGKSDWQVGQILSISQKTVNYHVENAKRKYGVATRIQAIVEALRDGTLDSL